MPTRLPAPVDASVNEQAELYSSSAACRRSHSPAKCSTRGSRGVAAVRQHPRVLTLPKLLRIVVYSLGRQARRAQERAVTDSWHSHIQPLGISAIMLRCVPLSIANSRFRHHRQPSVPPSMRCTFRRPPPTIWRGAGRLTAHRLAAVPSFRARAQAPGPSGPPFSRARPADVDRRSSCSVQGGVQWFCSAGPSTCTA